MKKIVIGLTGGLGSGKSTVLAQLKALGAVTADADAIARLAVEPGGAVYGKVRRLFGPGSFFPDGTMDRKAVAKEVFTNPSLRRKLEAAVHPVVRRELQRTAARVKRGVVVLDVPLLYEVDFESLADRVCVVWAPQAVRYRRLMDGGRFSCRDIRDRMRAQLPLVEKRRRADDVIDNGGSRAATRAKVLRLWEAWRQAL